MRKLAKTLGEAEELNVQFSTKMRIFLEILRCGRRHPGNKSVSQELEGDWFKKGCRQGGTPCLPGTSLQAGRSLGGIPIVKEYCTRIQVEIFEFCSHSSDAFRFMLNCVISKWK